VEAKIGKSGQEGAKRKAPPLELKLRVLQELKRGDKHRRRLS